MSEGPGSDPGEQLESGTGRPSTGDRAVDEVIASLDALALAGTPVHQHVAAFEHAHQGLRDALAGAGEPDAGA